MQKLEMVNKGKSKYKGSAPFSKDDLLKTKLNNPLNIFHFKTAANFCTKQPSLFKIFTRLLHHLNLNFIEDLPILLLDIFCFLEAALTMAITPIVNLGHKKKIIILVEVCPAEGH